MGWDENGRFALLGGKTKLYSWVRPGSELARKLDRMNDSVVGFTRPPAKPREEPKQRDEDGS